jgi:hypothetical protein
MKTISKIFLVTMAAFFVAIQAQAVLFFARPYDPNLQRWIQRDPIGEAGGINLHTYVYNNPVNYYDPLGFLTVVVIGGPSPASSDNSSGNPFGHASIAVSGNGVYSFGTRKQDIGGSFTDFLNWQATYRDSTLYVLNTTPSQEQKILDYLKKQSPNIEKYPDNCANRVINALGAGGIDLTETSLASPIGFPIAQRINNFPDEIAYALGSHGPLQISFPKGSTLPGSFLTGFNPK